MNGSGIVAINENCGFFEINSPDDMKIFNPDDNMRHILGRDVAGVPYPELVCPEDREDVAQSILDTFRDGENGIPKRRSGRCIRHRILMEEDDVMTVALCMGYDARGYLICSLMKYFDDLGGETGSKYRSNNVLESFAMSMAVLRINREGMITVKYANDDFYRMIGWNRVEFKEVFNEYLGDEIIHPDDFPIFYRGVSSMGEENRQSFLEVRILNMNGEATTQEAHIRFLYMENERALVSVIFNDITERRRLRLQLMIENERFNIIQSNSEQTIFDYDTENDVCVLSGDTVRLGKYFSVYSSNSHRNEIVIEDFFNGRFPLNIMSKDDYSTLCDSFADAIVNGGTRQIELQASAIGQTSCKWFKCVYSAVRDDMGNVIRIVGRIKDIDKQKKADMLMESRMKYDMLTGLLNKDTAKARIRDFLSEEKADADGEKFHALMIIDLDNFHRVNEYFGHTFGDNVLKEFASDIKSSFRDSDIVCRLVGDRFMVLMKSVTQKFAVKKAGRLCRSLVKSYGVTNAVRVSCSIGVSFFGKDASDFDGLYKFAESATYEAKKNGKCAYCIYDGELEEDYSSASQASNGASEDNVPPDSEISELDTNLMDIAFSLVSTSDDIYGMLDILLRTVGRKYNLSTVSVYARSYDGPDRLKKVHRWISNRNIPVRDGRSPLVTMSVDLDELLKGVGIRSIPDIAASGISPALRTAMVNDGMTALVMCGMEGRVGELFGCVVFNQFERRRKWSRKEVNTFKYITKIIATAIAGKYADRSLIITSPDEE